MSLYDDQNELAKWIAGAVTAAILLWKAFFHMRRDTREDKDGGTRQGLISNLQEEIRRLSELVMTLDAANERCQKQVDDEIERRRELAATSFECQQREVLLQRKVEHLERRVNELEGKK